MKIITPACAVFIACVLLAGCGKPLPPPVNLAVVTAGFDAFKAGDQAALERGIQSLAAGLPADLTSGVFVGCTPEGYALRRIARAKQQLEYLDQPTVLSMGDEVKFIYFQQLISGGGGKVGETGEVGGPTDFECERDPAYPESHQLDDQERYAIRDAGRDRMRTWFAALRQSLGDQFDPSMQNAAKQLNANKLRDIDRWTAPSSI
jgi:hypothetical protein